MTRVRTEEELGSALEARASVIEIEGDLGRKIVRIKAVGAVTWLIAGGSIALAAWTIWNAPPVGIIGAGGAVAVLGVSATITAAGLYVYAGPAGVKALREGYVVESSSRNLVVLRKKK